MSPPSELPIRFRQPVEQLVDAGAVALADLGEIGIVGSDLETMVAGETVAPIAQEIERRADRKIGPHGRIERQQRAFRRRRHQRLVVQQVNLPEDIVVELFVDERDVLLLATDNDDDDDEAPVPQIILLSSGDINTFEIHLFREASTSRYRLAGDNQDGIVLTAPGEE